MTQEQVAFGRRLQKEREARALTLAEIARVTKIPERVLDHLETGAWQSLPAEVFVRGFLKSYCRLVGLDADETVRHYGELCRGGNPVAPVVTLTAPSPRSSPASSSDGPLPAPAPVAAASAAPPKEEQSLLAALAEASRGSSRTSLTVAVIILVIVATLTLSLLLRRPSHVGDGVSTLATASLGV